MGKGGLTEGIVKCPHCHKKFLKPVGATVKKCDWCGHKYKFGLVKGKLAIIKEMG